MVIRQNHSQIEWYTWVPTYVVKLRRQHKAADMICRMPQGVVTLVHRDHVAPSLPMFAHLWEMHIEDMTLLCVDNIDPVGFVPFVPIMVNVLPSQIAPTLFHAPEFEQAIRNSLKFQERRLEQETQR